MGLHLCCCQHVDDVSYVILPLFFMVVSNRKKREPTSLLVRCLRSSETHEGELAECLLTPVFTYIQRNLKGIKIPSQHIIGYSYNIPVNIHF